MSVGVVGVARKRGGARFSGGEVEKGGKKRKNVERSLTLGLDDDALVWLSLLGNICRARNRNGKWQVANGKQGLN